MIDLVLNVEVNLCCGAVLGYLLAVQFHFQFCHSPHFMPRTVFAASATAFSAALCFSKALFRCSNYINHFLRHLQFSFEFDCSVWIVIASLHRHRPFSPAATYVAAVVKDTAYHWLIRQRLASVEHASISHRQTTVNENRICRASATLDCRERR